MNHSLLLRSLGWALLNSLWQFGLLWMAFMAITGLFRKWNAASRHSLALLLSVAGLVWFLKSLLSSYSGQTGLLIRIEAGWLTKLVGGQLPDQYIIGITYLYLAVTAAQVTRFSFSFYRSHALYSSGVSRPPAEISLFVRRIAMQLSIKRPVSVFISSYVDTPLVIGFLKPAILLPLASINRLSVPQLEAILLHELSHIKRNDYLVNIYIASMEILFFFNPFARMLFQQVKREREYSCDDWVMQYDYDPHAYATALLTLDQSRTGYLRTTLAATGASRRILLQRVQRILHVETASSFGSRHFSSCMAVLCVLGVLVVLQPHVTSSALANPGRMLLSLARLVPARLRRAPELSTPVVLNRPLRTYSPVSDRKTADIHNPQKAVAEPGEADSLRISVFNDDEITSVISMDAVNTENRSFSIPDADMPEPPPSAATNSSPYVPSSSFYYSTDTTKPVLKVQTYAAHSAQQAYLQAKKALDQINWKEIRKQLPAKVRIDRLRKQIEQSISQVNWQRINEEVRDSLESQTNMEVRQDLLKAQEEIKNWKYQQQRLDLLQNQLNIQEKNYRLEAEKKSLEIKKQLTGKVVIYL